MSDLIERHVWKGEGGVRKLLVPTSKAINPEARTIEFIVSTAARDRDGDVVEPAGWEFDAYRKNPVVLWGHDSHKPPIAKAISIGIEGGALKAVAQFATAEEYGFADTVFRLYQGGYLNAVSAGFLPKELEPIMEDGSQWPSGYRMTKQELWEFSCVAIPSNPEALVAARSKGIDTGEWLKRIEQDLDEGGGLDRELLSRAYVIAKGKVHPSIQRELAERNHIAAEAKAVEPVPPAEAAPEDVPEDVPPVMLSTGPSDAEGGDGHAHDFQAGAAQTEPGGDDGHMHAITYGEAGDPMVEPNDQHGHPVKAKAAPEDPARVAVTCDGAAFDMVSISDPADDDTRTMLALAPQKSGGVVTIKAGGGEWTFEVTRCEPMGLSVADALRFRSILRPVAPPRQERSAPEAIQTPAPVGPSAEEIRRMVNDALVKHVGQAVGEAFAHARGRVPISEKG